jgi:hypothetical protein
MPLEVKIDNNFNIFNFELINEYSPGFYTASKARGYSLIYKECISPLFQRGLGFLGSFIIIP